MSPMRSWKDISSFDDLLAFTHWESVPKKFHHSNFSTVRLKAIATSWWLRMEKYHGQFLKGSAHRILEDEDLNVRLYLQQRLTQVNKPKHLTPHFKLTLDKLLSTSALKSGPTKRQDAAFSAEEKFNGKYAGSVRLLHHIKRCYSLWCDDKKTYLSPYISIVGPSGVGKSFAVKQLASCHSQYVIYISFGKIHGLGFPQRSLVANSYSFEGFTRDEMEDAWVKGLTIQVLLARCASRMGISSSDFWLLQTSGKYKDFQQAVFLLVRDQVESVRSNQDSTQDSTQNLVRGPGQDSSAAQRVLEEKCYGILKPYAKSSASQQLCDLFIIAIDEARGLFTRNFNQSNGTVPFRALRVSLSTLSETYPVFALFLDTTSQVANFSPPAAFDPSQKLDTEQNEPRVLFPPFYEFYTYRVFSPKPTHLNLQSPDLSPETVLRYGHPMFGAFLDAGMSAAKVLKIAHQKLNPNIPHNLENTPSEVRYLALLLYLVSFEVLNHQYSSKLVSGWMHVLCGISDDREKVELGHSVSPALAVCALCHLSADSILLSVLKDFATKLGWGHVSTGDIGEVVAGLGLVLSMGMVHLSKMVPVQLPDFVQRFLSTKVSDKLLGTSHSWIKQGEVFFNRVVRFQSSQSCYPTPDDLLYLYSSCCACFLPANTDGADIIVPVRISSTTTKTTRARMGCILIQVKNRQNDTLIPSLEAEACVSIANAVEKMAIDTKKTPVLGMMVCLRTKQNGHSGSAVVEAIDQSGSYIPVCLGVGLNSSVFSFLQNHPDAVRNALLELLSMRTNCKFQKDPYRNYVYETTVYDQEPETCCNVLGPCNF